MSETCFMARDQAILVAFGVGWIAASLGFSDTTVRSHLRVIYARLGAESRAEAAATALRLGLVD